MKPVEKKKARSRKNDAPKSAPEINGDSEAQKPAKKSTKTEGLNGPNDPEAEGAEEADEEEIKEALSRPPPVNSDYLPLPWKGRLGYVCLV